MDFNQILEVVTIWALPVIFAITLHEAAHGWVANKLGDPTARVLGRITMNPLKHIDLIGTVIVPLVLVVLGGFVFGWAKPVPVDMRNFKQPFKDMALVAAAGPISNLLMACFWTLIMAIAINWLTPDQWIKRPLAMMSQAGVVINLILMVLNLLPLLPLDGGRVVTGLLSPRAAMTFMKIEPYGMIILLLLLFSGILGKILGPVVGQLQSIVYTIVGI
ncbi:MAG: site-2 protease family protein [Gammaproteobacteria bacterium]|nr:site-2 protease family protein [Gammaproteobacteria bacterium]